MCEMEGEGVVRENLAQRWFQRFNTGEESTIGNQDTKLLPGHEQCVKWKEKVSLESIWHNDGSNDSTLEKKAL